MTTSREGTHNSAAGASARPQLNDALPLVSIVIPAYNVAPYIGETLRSVFAQTFTDFEVIVINDGSPDTQEFERLLMPFRERIRYLKQENRGASAARNAGLRAARGEFVGFLDADDLWLPNYLEDQLAVIRERNCDLVCADALIVGESPDAGRTYFETVMEAAPPKEVTFLDLLSGERSLITSGVLARREHVLEVGLFDEKLRNAQDFDLWLRLARHGSRLAYQPRVLLTYRARLNSLTGNPINSHLRELLIFEKVRQSYGLTPEEHAEVEPVIRKRTALVQYELGKLYLLPGDFARAREAFATSNRLRPSLKTRGALWFARLAPSLMKALYVRRSLNRPQSAPKPGDVQPENHGAPSRFQEQT
jgi:glycosyltransferase involved in cell wall biosynthesis